MPQTIVLTRDELATIIDRAQDLGKAQYFENIVTANASTPNDQVDLFDARQRLTDATNALNLTVDEAIDRRHQIS